MQIELLKTHVHAGLAHPPGAVITLEDDLARWLVDSGVARAATAQPAPKPTTRSEEKSP